MCITAMQDKKILGQVETIRELDSLLLQQIGKVELSYMSRIGKMKTTVEITESGRYLNCINKTMYLDDIDIMIMK